MNWEKESRRRRETGYVPEGWTAQRWREELLRLAAKCEAIQPVRAAELREWAGNVSEEVRTADPTEQRR